MCTAENLCLTSQNEIRSVAPMFVFSRAILSLISSLIIMGLINGKMEADCDLMLIDGGTHSA